MRATAMVAAAAMAGGAAALAGCASADRHDRAVADGTTTATVQRRTLITREQVSGTLGYADPRPLLSRLAGGAGSSAPATITWVPDEGATIRRGEALYRLDGEPVRLLYGTTPAYRALRVGDEGRDVAQLERNLKALGYDPGSVDGTFDGDTAAAVRAWQADAGWEQTGEVALGQVAFLPGARRVGTVAVEAGGVVAAAGAEVLQTTSRRQVVHIDLDADEQQLARGGERVTVSLPGGHDATGRITQVGTVAQGAASTGQSDQGAGDQGSEDGATIDVTVRLDRSSDAGRFDGAPVSVGLVDEVSRDTLAVPVTALLARPGGGYAVERRTATGVKTVPVTVGPFTDGFVGVTSPQLRAGDKVVVPDGEL